MSLVLPGQHVAAQHVNLKLGPGLLQTSGDASTSAPPIIATRAGTLNHNPNGSKWWVENNSRRYVPAAQESVVGVIIQKAGEGFRVDIGSAQAASLDGLAFESATKRNKPNLKIGSLVYARVSLAHKDMEPELECFDAQTRKSEGFGELKGGFMVRCSSAMCRQLLDSKHFLLPMLGARFPLETAIGVNGRVWVNAKDVREVIGIARCIEAVDPDVGGTDEAGIANLLRNLGL
ncbi:exosome complex exonuclease RRP40 [Mycena alexandri]|uniref:Ribosomal RNA-processing protein 40 n=1 Tax=Mycena alexandri TaxID=1745969 RepID=A0AAD6TM19_9AGAR|nr:exosome complex exonuclease RRP40 [Mycena alexandri]